MQRITVTLTNEQADRLKREARRRGLSVSELVRRKVEPEATTEGRRHIPWAGIFESDGPPYAADLDEFLAANWADEIR
jgi:Arc/MetJ-type ribon-helix-helix transcriptional regulator